MSKYEYKDWSIHISQTVIGNKKVTKNLIRKYDEMITCPPLPEFIDYQRMQYFNAVEAGKVDQRWHTLQNSVTKVEKALISREISLIAMAFMELGKAIKAFHYPSSSELIDMAIANLEKIKKEMPLHKRNATKTFLIKTANEVAQVMWEYDTEKKIRLTQMCEKVWPVIVNVANEQNCIDVLPNGSESLKDWLRENSPEWAKKRGRPKNK